MADPAAARVHPLAVLGAGSMPGAGATLRALPPACRISLRADPQVAAAIAAAIGLPLPEAMCRANVLGARAALRLGPDEWLLIGPEAAGESLARVAMAVPGPASVVDVSHRSTALEIAGPRAVAVLGAFCALDLDAAAFPVGMCTRTLLGKAEIVLWRSAAECFRIEVWRSFAPYVWNCLEEGRLEFFI